MNEKVRWIYCENGHFSCVSEEDWGLVKGRLWWMDPDGYVRLSQKSPKPVYLAREIIKPDLKLDVDHISGVTWDNRRSNLRAVTRAENMHNSKKTGVHYVGWVVHLSGKWIGHYDTEEEAQVVYGSASLARSDASVFNRPLEPPPKITQQEMDSAVVHREKIKTERSDFNATKNAELHGHTLVNSSGERFASIRQAAIKYGIPYMTFSKAIKAGKIIADLAWELKDKET